MTTLLRRIPISLYYIVVATAWIGLSDRLLLTWISSPDWLAHWQTVKGVIFVLATGAALHMVLRHSQRRQTLARRRIQNLNGFYNAISKVADAAMRADQSGPLYKAVCEAVVDNPGILVSAVALIEPDGMSIRSHYALGPAADLYDQPLSLDPTHENAASVSLRAIQTRKPCICNDIRHEPGFEIWHAQYLSRHINAFAAFPVFEEGQLVGTLTVASRHRDYFNIELVELLERLADVVSFGQGHLRRLKRLRLMDRLIERANDGVIVTDREGVILAVNARFCQVSGYESHELLGQTTRLLHSARQGPNFFRDMWQRLLQQGHWRGQIWNRRKGGDIHPEWLTISAVLDEQGQTEHYLAVYSDLSERMEAELRIRELSSLDTLTGVLNAEVFRARLAEHLQKTRKNRRRALVAVLNLNRLRVINQAYGREKGDRILSEIGERLRALNLPDALIGRLGGDEFGIAVGGLNTLEDVMRHARRIGSSFNALFALDADTLLIRPSIGAVCFPEHGDDTVTVLANATAAVQRCKREGLDTVRLYTPDLSHEVSAPFELEQDLRRAIDNGELWLAFQPQLRISDGTPIGMETLLRWDHPTLGAISPAKFIPVAEESGLILPIGEWILFEACRHAAKWNRGREQALRVAVNVSAVQFQRQNWPRLVEKALLASELAPGCLELEVTESVVMQHIDAVAMRLRALKALGVQLAIDDFGTGYSSLAYLKRLPIDRLKIDQSFVRGLPGDAGDAAIARAICGLAVSLDFETIAEGVETAEQAAALLAMGCPEAQGWHYARAMPAAEFEQWLHKHG
ncbi:EAL domain-containing protein [Chitinimonas arctica]|uniref:EAL domain-containing protein n=1 Tax=Chitinimonas arctica TaxID=2594795 RepID=A0A516SAC8_9NEIS|nr:EAL domain-containing protein [Chitinimonas arctica]QDQ25008.1 EAL domain-containing protein [Chitinimonas arctica]